MNLVLQTDVKRLYEVFKRILTEQKKEYLDSIRNDKESLIEKKLFTKK